MDIKIGSIKVEKLCNNRHGDKSSVLIKISFPRRLRHLEKNQMFRYRI